MNDEIELAMMNKSIRVRCTLASIAEDWNGQDFIVGGQARLYKCRVDNQLVVLKVMPDYTPGAPDMFRRANQLRMRVARLPSPVKERIAHRGLSIGQGIAPSSAFGFSLGRLSYILVFRYVEGKTLAAYLRGDPPMSAKRRGVTRQLLDILAAFEEVGIVHSDLYPDNFLVDVAENLHPLDLEGAGIRAQPQGGWEFAPKVVGKDYWFPPPPEIKINNGTPVGTPNEGSDIWIGAALVFWSLLGYQPFSFLTRADELSLTHLRRRSQLPPDWPPNLKPNLPFEDQQLPASALRSLVHQHLSDTDIGRLLYSTYILNYDKPLSRPRFAFFKTSIQKVL